MRLLCFCEGCLFHASKRLALHSDAHQLRPPHTGPSSLGIFRRSPSAANVAHLEAAYRRGHPVRLDLAPDAPYLAASLLKRHLARMVEPVLSRAVCEEAKRCPLEGDDAAAVAFIRVSILPLVSEENLALLTDLVRVLARIANHASQNLMTAENLVICVCPALVGGIGGSVEEVRMCRVPGMDIGTMRGGLWKEEARSENTAGGVLKVMIER